MEIVKLVLTGFFDDAVPSVNIDMFTPMPAIGYGRRGVTENWTISDGPPAIQGILDDAFPTNEPAP